MARTRRHNRPTRSKKTKKSRVARRRSRTHRSRRHRGGCGAGGGCQTTAGAATNGCFPNDGIINGPYGFMRLDSVKGMYPKQL